MEMKDIGKLVSPEWLKGWKSPVVIGDFSKLDNDLKSGLISQDEYQKTFEITRFHGFKGDIFPFCIGGSDAPIIANLSPWTTPLGLYYQKTGLKKKNVSRQQEFTFLAGHLFEAPIRELFAKKRNLTVTECPLQCMHSNKEKYPHLVANIDGLVIENGKLGIYEGKTTRPFTETWQHFKGGIVPPYYEWQVRFYMEIWDVDFAYINCASGFGAFDQMIDIKVERNKPLGESILEECEDFVENAILGIPPKFSGNCSFERTVNECKEIFNPNPKNPPAKLPDLLAPTFQAIKSISEQINIAEEEIKPEKKKVEDLKKKRTDLYKTVLPYLENAEKGILKTEEGTYTFDAKIESKMSLDQEVKDFAKNAFPDEWDIISSYKVKNSPKITVYIGEQKL